MYKAADFSFDDFTGEQPERMRKLGKADKSPAKRERAELERQARVARFARIEEKHVGGLGYVE